MPPEGVILQSFRNCSTAFDEGHTECKIGIAFSLRRLQCFVCVILQLWIK